MPGDDSCIVMKNDSFINSPAPHEPDLAKNKSRFRKYLRIVLFLVLAVIIGALIKTTSDVYKLKKHNPETTALMEYRQGQYRIKGQKYRIKYRWRPISDIPSYLIQAILIAEDDKFYMHEGFDWEAIKEAWEKNEDKDRIVRGGSTITQQLAKNLYLTPDRTSWRKLREALIAITMELFLSKRRILELYLNVIEWGRGIYGAEAASRHYFGKKASELTVTEAIRLASVLPNPIRYSPTTDTSKRMSNRRKMIADRMYKKHLIDDEIYQGILDTF